MRIRNSLIRDRELGDSQTMTPMIDIVFLLLIFFVCVATDQVIEYSLPTELAAGSVEANAEQPQESWVTEIHVRVTQPQKDLPATIELNNRRLTNYDQFRETLLALAGVSRDSPVILDVSNEVQLGEMIRVYDTARAAEFDSIHFATKKSELGL